jgi:hypothetical protein
LINFFPPSKYCRDPWWSLLTPFWVQIRTAVRLPVENGCPRVISPCRFFFRLTCQIGVCVRQCQNRLQDTFSTMFEFQNRLILQNIKNTFLILSCTPSFAIRRASICRAWTLQGVESVPQGCWSMITPMLPTIVSSLLHLLWVVDHS